jgi:hypothetical protein
MIYSDSGLMGIFSMGAIAGLGIGFLIGWIKGQKQ